MQMNGRVAASQSLVAVTWNVGARRCISANAELLSPINVDHAFVLLLCAGRTAGTEEDSRPLFARACLHSAVVARMPIFELLFDQMSELAVSRLFFARKAFATATLPAVS